MNKQIKHVVVVAAMAAAMWVGVAQAAEVPAQVVGFKDLNLKTDAGVQALYKRIHGAADQVCGNVGGRDPEIARAHEACVRQAMADAVTAVNNQMLTKTVAVAQVR